MGTGAYEVVRFRGRYYAYWHNMDGYLDGLGAKIVAAIPVNPEEYRKWLISERDKYAAMERDLEQSVYGILDTTKSDYSLVEKFDMLPSELPRLCDADYIYITNLDHEVLTINYSIHWKLGSIPRQNDLWLRAICESIYEFEPTISRKLCPEECMASLVLELPVVKRKIGFSAKIVTPRTTIGVERKTILACFGARLLIEYKNEIIRFGREWSPESFSFRELTFALVSIASDQAKFHSFPEQLCNPYVCINEDCTCSIPLGPPGWISRYWAADGDGDALLEFGSMSHRPGKAPGVSPTTTMYWLGGVLVSLALVVDGQAITKAVTWGIEHGGKNFQIVVMSLFHVAFAEVSSFNRKSPLVMFSRAITLSPLREKFSMSTHPRERPVQDGRKFQSRIGARVMKSNCTQTVEMLQDHFPGVAGLINFFDTAARRKASIKSSGSLCPELYSRILDFVDYDTWKACCTVSLWFRDRCLRKYRLDWRVRIVKDPLAGSKTQNHPHLSFNFEDMVTGKIYSMCLVSRLYDRRGKYNWMPVIGGSQKALLEGVVLQFAPHVGSKDG